MVTLTALNDLIPVKVRASSYALNQTATITVMVARHLQFSDSALNRAVRAQLGTHWVYACRPAGF